MTLSTGERAPEVVDVHMDGIPDEPYVADPSARGLGRLRRKSSLNGGDKAEKAAGAATAKRAKAARGQIRATAIPPKSVKTSESGGLLGEGNVLDVKMGSLKRTLTGQDAVKSKSKANEPTHMMLYLNKDTFLAQHGQTPRHSSA